MVSLAFLARGRTAPLPADAAPAPAEAETPGAAASTVDLMELVEEDIRRSRGQVEEAGAAVAARLADGAALSQRVLDDAGALEEAIAAAGSDVDALAQSFADVTEAGRAITAEIATASQLADQARAGAGDAVTGVAELQAATRRIETVIGLIAKVAKQTNLLALNATIEAERAGAAGRGFAVVAKEVKALSIETQRATDEISQTIASLQSAARRSEETVQAVTDTIARITPSFTAVAAAVERQGGFIGEAAERAGEVRRFMAGVADRAGNMQRNSAEAARTVDLVRSATDTLAEINARTSARLTTVLRQTPGADRRRHDRFPVTMPLRLATASGTAATETVDLSCGGLLAKPAGAPPAVGERIEADLGGIGRLRGRVVGVSGQGVHIAFEDLTGETASRLSSRVASIQAEYQPLIDRARQAAAQISELFAQSVARGDVSEATLFDTAYRPVPGSDPVQVETPALPFLRRVLQPLQEALVASDPRMAFAAAVDRNGWLPVHNLVFSKPQRPGDPAWNAANARDRRIFDDRTGLLAARNTRPFLIQAYNRDMGNGVTVLMKEVDAPITVAGRHWGGFRTSYRM